jgi:hypothetical protein
MTLTAISLCLAMSTTVSAQSSYSRLQVLLPGETAAPGTATGRLGTPTAQTVGIAFDVIVRACDDNWNTISANTNLVALNSSNETAVLPGPIALVDGQVTLSVTFQAAGSFTVSATDQSDATIPEAVSSPVTAMALEGFVFEKINQKNQYAGQPMSTTVSAVDAAGAVVTGFTGDVQLRQITSFGEGRIEPSIVTLSNGTWAGAVTMYRADETSINRGNVNMEASLIGSPSINGTSDPFTVHPGTYTRLQIIAPGQSPLPGSVEGLTGSPASQSVGQTFTVQVYATDQYWNPLPSTDTVRLTSSDTGASTPLTSSLSNGATQFTLSMGTVGTQTLSVGNQTNSSIQGMTSAGIPVLASSVAGFAIEAISGPLTAGVAVSVTIRATDSGGNTIPDYDGDALLSANTGLNSISPNAITFSNGLWTGDVTFRGAGGAVTLSCADFASPPHTGTSASFEVLPGIWNRLQVLLPGQTAMGGTEDGHTGNPDVQSAGSPFDVRVRATDAYWNRVPGINARIEIVSTDAFASLAADTALVNGELTISGTLYKAGTQIVLANSLDNPGIQPGISESVEIVGGPYDRLLVLAPGEMLAPGTEFGRAGTATDQSINFAFNVEVYATDSWYNPVGGVGDMVQLTSSDGLAELPANTALADGSASLPVRLSTGGFQQITVSNADNPAMMTSTTQVRAISSGFHLEADVTPTNVQAGESFTLTVRVTNDAGSVIQEINSAVEVEVQNATTRDPGQGILSNTSFQLLQGQRSVALTYTYAEPILLIIRDDAGNAPAVTEAITVRPGAPSQITLTGSPNPDWIRANQIATLEAAVVDGFGNGVPSAPVQFSLIDGGGVLTPLDPITGANGVARAEFLSPRVPQVTTLRAASGAFVDDLVLETTLVDPAAPAGMVTNYPNPFHPGEAPTTIAYKLAVDSHVRLRIFTLSGSLVLDKEFLAGSPGAIEGLNEYEWDGRNGNGDLVASGGYLVSVDAENNGETQHLNRRKIGVVR